MNAVKNKITIFHDDLDRLNDGEFLNDTIIEFYLRLQTAFFSCGANSRFILDHLPLEMKEMTHFFNSFFWTNLIRKNAAGYSLVRIILSNRKRGHDNVKKWTSKVDLFSKKYVVVPVNEAYDIP